MKLLKKNLQKSAKTPCQLKQMLNILHLFAQKPVTGWPVRRLKRFKNSLFFGKLKAGCKNTQILADFNKKNYFFAVPRLPS